MFLSRLLGFAVNILGKSPSGVSELLSDDLVSDFVQWGLGRGLSVSGFRSGLAPLNASIKEYDAEPFLASNFSWLDAVIRDLGEDSRELINQRKARRWIEYDELDAIPAKIHTEIKRSKCGLKRNALRARNALLMALLRIVPLRQSNLRGCKLGSPETGGNLFRGPISPLSTVAKSPWVLEALKSNPKEAFWQLFFRKHEMKGKREFHIIWPLELVAPLEEYLTRYRPPPGV